MAYVAPEIVRYHQYDGRADIWSLGCVFYEMVSGGERLVSGGYFWEESLSER